MPLALCVLLACAPPRVLDTPLRPEALAQPPSDALGTELPLLSVDPELRGLLAQVSALRGLKPPPVLRLVELPADELAQAALAHAAQDWPEPARRAQALLLWRLGLLPAEPELLELLRPALQAQLTAFYARQQGVPTLFVRSTLAGKARRRALAHELVHALQDHEHGLLRRLADDVQSSDRRSALHALAEADALAVEEQLGLAGAESAVQGPPAPLPAVLLRSLEAPYRDGRELVTAALRKGGFAAVDRWLHAPPASTHALLQPGSTAATGAFAELPAPGAEWQLSHGDVLGEQGLRVVLAEAGVALAERSSRWRADRLTVFHDGAGSALAWQIELAEPEAAAAVEPLLQRGRRGPDFGTSTGTAPAGAEWTCGTHRDAGVVATARQRRNLVFASLTTGAQIVSAAAQCATLRAWVFRGAFRFATRV